MSDPDQTARHRGQSAERPVEIPARGYLEIVIRVAKRVSRDQLGLVAAGVAFFGMLALFPALAALVALGGMVADPVQIVTEAEAYLAALPDAARDIVQGQLVELSGADDDSLGIAALIALALAIFSSSRGMANLIAGLNIAYEEREGRGFVMLQVWVLALTLFALLTGLLALGILAAIPFAVHTVLRSDTLTALALVLRWPLLLGITSLAFTVIYRFGPSRRQAKWRWIAPGGVVAVVIWTAATFGFAWYVQAFGSYNETFGALGGVVILLLWLWLSAFSILLGATLDAEMEAQTARDSTVGEDRPLGQRGAIKADTCIAGSKEPA